MNNQRPPLSAGAFDSTPKHKHKSTDFITPNSSRTKTSNATSTPHLSPVKSKGKVSNQRGSFINSSSNSKLDYFTNNHFSRSFNLLILDDIKDELKSGRRKINKSPPFNIKQDFYVGADAIDDYLEVELSGDDIATDTDETTQMDVSERTQTCPLPQTKTLSLSIKRSSKYLNLSIDSRSKFTSNTNPPNEDIDTISDLNEIDLSLRPSREPTPIDSSSPVVRLNPSSTPYSNKFKRPHQLVSQSPSPSSCKITPRLSVSSASASPAKQQQNLYSPSKLGLKGFKMFKNSDKMAIISPNRSNVFNQNSTPSTRAKLAPLQTKLRKTSLNTTTSTSDNEPSSPLYKPTTSSPVNYNFEYYNLDGLDIEFDNDLPSKRKQDESRKNLEKLILLPEKLTDKENIPPSASAGPGTKSFRFVKPLQTAFKSSGLVKKNSVSKESRKLPPETPMKKNPLLMLKDPANSRTSSLSNLISSSHDESYNDLEMSIEVGRNTSHTNANDSSLSLSFFKVPTTSASKSKVNVDLDLDLLYQSGPETPTRSVQKSHSMPAHLSPALRPRLSFSGPRVQSREPSTPTNAFFRSKSSSVLPVDSVNSSDATICSGDGLGLFYHDQTETTESNAKKDDHLVQKFGLSNIKYLGTGEFSVAFECQFHGQKFAIKRSKKPVVGKLERKAIAREIDALRVLTSVKDNEKANLQEQQQGKDHLVYFIEAWDFNHYYYIMTEFCEGGTLSEFLELNKNYKMDEFRVWKILIEILTGLKFIHMKNYLHLDLKPANIFVTFEGLLKIGDFGLATKLPILEKDFDLEGDRNYIAPELINDKIYTPFADIFSVGLIILEIATNIILPDNGTPWRKLRSGDLSDAGKLSSDNILDFLNHQNFLSLTSYNSVNLTSSLLGTHLQQPHRTNRRSVDIKDLIPAGAPDFLVCESSNLDRLVARMLKPNPFDRPNARTILEMDECQAIDARRKAAATIFEGEFGPADEDM